ncbi:MAG: hypothetical protein AAGF53_06620 [Pseudomonadota bacterium]
MRFLQILIFGFFVLAFQASLAEEKLTAEEIETLLNGNTIKGVWSGNNYTQYFGENGETAYIPEGRMPDIGRWRVNIDTDQYESWWEQTGWTGYTVLKVDEGYGWKRSDGYEPFTVLEGKRVSW